MTTEHHHTAFGLHIRSCIALPEVVSAPEADGDVRISYGTVPAELEGTVARGVRYQAAAGRLQLQVDGIARYLISGGREITIDRDPAADDDDVRLFLLGSALGALLHQRQDLVLHGSAIDAGGWAAAFIGRSGAGKSTLSTAFRKKGYPILTDDLCVLRAGAVGNELLVHPGPPQSKLWLDSLKRLDISPDNLRQIRRKLEKRAVPLGDGHAASPLPLRKLYVLRPNHQGELKLTPVEGPAKFNLLKMHTYRFGYVGGLGEKPAHFQQAMALAKQARLTIALRPSEPFQLDELAAAIEADLKA